MLSSKKTELFNSLFLYGYVLLFPLFAVLYPDTKLLGLDINADMIIRLIICLLSVFFTISWNFLKVSKVTFSLFIFILYIFLNTYIRGYSELKTTFFYVISTLILMIAIDNTNFTVEHYRRFKIIIFVLIVIICIGSLLQQFVDKELFWSAKNKMEFSNFYGKQLEFDPYIYRHESIFASQILYTGFIAILMFSIIMLNEMPSKKYIRIIFFCLMTIIIALTYTRVVMASFILILLIYFIRKEKINFLLLLHFLRVVLFFAFVIYVILNNFVSESFISNRLLASTSGRTDNVELFVTKYLFNEHPLMFGVGQSSYMCEYYYSDLQRLHTGIWDTIFRGGIVGIVLYLNFLFHYYKKTKKVYNKWNNLVILSTIPIIFFINLSWNWSFYIYYGYIVMYYYVSMKTKISTNSNF